MTHIAGSGGDRKLGSGGDSCRGKFREWMGKGWFCREMGSPALDLRPQDGAGVRMASCPQSILNVTRSQSYDPNTICDNHTPCGNPEFRFLFYSPPSLCTVVLSNGKLRPPPPTPAPAPEPESSVPRVPSHSRGAGHCTGLPGGLTLPCSSPRDPFSSRFSRDWSLPFF